MMPVRNITLTDDHQSFVRQNYKKINKREMARKLKITYSKLVNNMRLMGLYDSTDFLNVDFATPKGTFDIDKWGDYLGRNYYDY